MSDVSKRIRENRKARKARQDEIDQMSPEEKKAMKEFYDKDLKNFWKGKKK